MVFDILPTPGFRKNRIGTISNRHQKPVGETPTGCALFNYALGVVSGVGSATILKLNVLGNAKKSPPTTVAVTI